MKTGAGILSLVFIFCVSVLAEDWNPTPMVIDAEDVVTYAFDGTDVEIPFSLSGKNAKIWLVIESRLHFKDRPVAVMNGFKGWHFVNGIDTTVYVSSARSYDIGTDQLFPWDGTGNEKQYTDRVSSDQVESGSYTYYLWGYDHESQRELVCDYLPIGSFWEGQYLRFYPHDETGALYDAPRLMGQVPYFLTNDSLGDEVLDRIQNATICKWKLGSDPLSRDLLETSTVAGFSAETISPPTEHVPGYGAGVFDPEDHDTYYFAKNRYWDQTQTVVKYQYVANGEAVQDTDWGDYDRVSWYHPGVNEDDTRHSVLYDLGDEYLVMLDGGTNPMETQHDRLHVFMKDDPSQEVFDMQLDEFYMPGQPDDPMTGIARTSSELNRLAPGRRDGTFYITGEFSCLTELVDVSRLIDAGGNLDPYSPDGSGYVVWANSNGDFFLDMSPYPDPYHPDQLWACIVSDPHNMNNPRRELSPADIHGFQIAFTEFTGTNTFGVYCPDGTGIEYTGYGDDAFSGSCGGMGWKGGGEIQDFGGQFDGLYMLSVTYCGIQIIESQYLKTHWIPFDSDSGIITTPVGIEQENPEPFTVAQNTPNPFNPTTTITFTLAKAGQVSVEVHNVAGQQVDTLVDGFMAAGAHSAVWNADGFAAGVYFYTVRSGEMSKTMKMTLLK